MNYVTQRSPGGYCCIAAGGSVIPSTGTGDVHQNITSPSGIARLIRHVFGISPTANAVGGGGGQSPETGNCKVFIGQVITAPTGGFGEGEVKELLFESDGSWSLSGDDSIAVIFPNI